MIEKLHQGAELVRGDRIGWQALLQTPGQLIDSGQLGFDVERRELVLRDRGSRFKQIQTHVVGDQRGEIGQRRRQVQWQELAHVQPRLMNWRGLMPSSISVAK